MLKFLVFFFLVAGGMTESDICDKLPDCNNRSIPDDFPTSEEELQKFCKPAIAFMRCNVHYGTTCGQVEPERLQMGYRILATLEEICSEDSLLHAVVVDNLKCFSKLLHDEEKYCAITPHSPDRLRQLSEALHEEGLVTLTNNENETYNLHECIQMMSFFACSSITIENACGTAAADAYVDIVQKVAPGVVEGCEESYDLLPAVIRLHKIEEEKEENIVEAFRKRK